MRRHEGTEARRHRGIAGWLCILVMGGVAAATDVGFWGEYRPDRDDAEQRWLLVSFDGAPLGAARQVELVGKAQVVKEGRFGKGLLLDGRSSVRCASEEPFPGGQVSVEAWVKLSRYPQREGFVAFRPAVVDKDVRYDPAVDRAKGFSLSIDAQGALHLETVNTFCGRRTRTSSEAGAVPVGRWVHVAGICAGARRLYVDGREVASKPVHWGEGLDVQGEEESDPQPAWIGNNDKGDAGLTGLIDQVRIHRNIYRFWAPEDLAWTDPQAARGIADGPPHFAAEHAPMVRVALDGNGDSAGRVAAKVELGEGDFRPGVRGQARAGRIAITAPGLFRSEAGSIEFWMRPLGVNSLSDRNRAFLGEPFIFYLFNGGTHEPTMYFADEERRTHFVHAPVEMHPARWYHVAITWRGRDIRLFIDGRQEGRAYGRELAHGGRRVADRFVLNPHETVALIDEVRIYDDALLPAEAANACWRYRDPQRLAGDVKLPAASLMGEHMPSARTFHYELTPRMNPADFAEASLTLLDPKGGMVKQWNLPWRSPMAGSIALPAMEDGPHALAASILTRQGQRIEGERMEVYSKRFAWEGNTLGITGEVFPPFTPVTVAGRDASVVQRTMRMNGFGLWDQVTSRGKELLAGPMTIRYETAQGEGAWDAGSVRLVEHEPSAAVFETEAKSAPAAVNARCTVEVDGCMRVEMTLRAGESPVEVRRMWIDVPLKDADAPLMHAIADGLRHNHAGAAPPGEGVVWDGSKAQRDQAWRNAFVPYVWLGGAERGVAFFAENDRGWITGKGKNAPPTHELIRQNGQLTLRAYLVNVPTTLAAPRQIVFGLQASPTKPMPANWRQRLPDMPGGLAVVPWGGLQCASQGPYGDDWSIVEKILEPRRGLPLDRAWIEAYAKRHNPPLVHGDSDWAYYAGHFAGRAREVGMDRPLAVYQEEMRAAHSRPEWIVYQDEWKTADGPQARTESAGLDLSGGHRSLSGISTITFPRSYADFGVWMANEWLKRGVSLYWDNTHLYPSYNTRTSAAYLAEDGRIQPALVIWNVRAYHQRVWNVLQQQRRLRLEPLEWTLHMTNTLVLPVHTWGTVNLDHELVRDDPFPPELLLAETTARQVGSHPLSLYEIYGRDNAAVKALPEAQRLRIEWAMRAVHEIQRRGPLEKHLLDFGYGGEGTVVHNYWDDAPVLEVRPASVKWLALSRTDDKAMLVILASWSKEPVVAEVRGISQAVDAETGKEVERSREGVVKVELGGPYGSRIVRGE